MLAAFEGAGLVCDIYFACEDARTAMTMAEKGLGIAILPESMLKLTNKLKAYDITRKTNIFKFNRQCLGY